MNGTKSTAFGILQDMSDVIEIHSCSQEKSTMSFPLGALCIKTAINSCPDIPKAALFTHETAENPFDEAKKCADRNPKAVGLSIYIWNKDWFDEFAIQLKKLSPHTMIFAGGPWCSSYTENIPSYLLFAVRGEGEITTIENIRRWLNNEDVKGLYLGEQPDLEKLDSVFLTHQADSLLQTSDGILWEMTRGCPFRCAFCFESRGMRKVRNYPLERIREELDYIVKKQVTNVFVLDPTFNLDSERAKAILRMLLEEAPPEMHFTFEIRAELVDSEMAELFASLNCSLQIGLQSSDKEVLKSINRDFDEKLFSEHVKMLSKTGATYGFDIIIGLPGDTIEKFRKTVNFAVSLMPSNIDIFKLSLLPCTELVAESSYYGYVTDNSLENTIISSPSFPEEEIENALKIKNATDLFYTKGQACMWLHCVLEALNISACNLFSLFDKWMKQTDRSEDEDIWILQDDFITSLFEKTGNTKLLGALKSFMELHQAICFVTDTGQPVEINLSYNPDDLAVLDGIGLSEFIKTRKMHKTHVVVDLDDCGNICLF